MTPPKAPIAILGAGPSGLTLGRLLEVAKIPYIIFDLDESANSSGISQGGTLDIHANSGQMAGLACWTNSDQSPGTMRLSPLLMRLAKCTLVLNKKRRILPTSQRLIGRICEPFW